MSDPRLDLAARLEAAEGASRERDDDIAVAVGKAERRDGSLFSLCAAGSTLRTHHSERYTSSLDAITGLIAEKLPGWARLFRDLERGGAYAHVMSPNFDYDHVSGEATAATPALALAAAFLRALAASAPLTAKEEG